MTKTLNRLAQGTIELTISVPWSEIKNPYDDVVKKFLEEIEIPGFRKGKAPKNLAEEKLDKTKAYEEIIKKIVPQIYAEAIKQENLNPIIPPRIEILSFKENEGCQLKILTCEKPKVELGNYQEELNKLKKEKITKIWVPGEDKKDNHKNKVTLEEIVSLLLRVCHVEVPILLIEDETNRMLSNLIDQTQKLGLTVEQYLTAQGKTSEGLKNEYQHQASQTLALDFILEAIAEKEKIEVNNEDLEKVIQEVKDLQEQEKLRQQSYYLATILRRQKTLEKLLGKLD